MAIIAETARIVTTQPGDDASEVVRNAWLLWRSVTKECERRNLEPTRDGYYMYHGALRTHVMRLWGAMETEERVELEKGLYSYLRATKTAVCVQRQNPPVWKVSREWRETAATAAVISITRFRPTSAERRVTAKEAGEHLPPGKVTVKTKETTHVPNANRAAPLAATHEKRREEREARQALAKEMLAGLAQPVTADEVSFAIGCEVSTVRKDLAMLADAGELFFRVETPEERKIRYGSVARSTRARLYSTQNPVPERTERTVVDGCTAEPAPYSTMSSSEIDRRLLRRLGNLAERTRWDIASLAEKSGVTRESARVRVKAMMEKGLIIKAGTSASHKNGQTYRMRDKEGVIAFLGGNGNGNGTPAPITVTKTTAPPVPAPPPSGIDFSARAAEILDDNERMREQNARLQARVLELEAQVEALTAPKIDPGVAERLAAWTPST